MLALPDTSAELRHTKKEISDWLFRETGGLVQGGPFEGMKLLNEAAWRETSLAPLLLGCYEEELHGELERQINRLKHLTQPKVAVVGCAEGYYAVGLKRRLPDATVYAIDTDDTALEICGRAAAANGVSVTAGTPVDVFMAADFILMDVEGDEVVYLDPQKLPCLAGAHMLVEIHNLPGQATDEILLERFRGTHRITFVFEGPRNPTKHKWLQRLCSDHRWAAVSEGRPCLMGWYIMEPRGVVA